jgi:hypothetical protein
MIVFFVATMLSGCRIMYSWLKNGENVKCIRDKTTVTKRSGNMHVEWKGFFLLYSGFIYSMNGLAHARLSMRFYSILFYFVDLFGLGRSMLTQPLLPWNWSLLPTLDLSTTSPDLLLLFFPS